MLLLGVFSSGSVLNRYDTEPSIRPTVPNVYVVANWGVDKEERWTRSRCGMEKSRRAKENESDTAPQACSIGKDARTELVTVGSVCERSVGIISVPARSI